MLKLITCRGEWYCADRGYVYEVNYSDHEPSANVIYDIIERNQFTKNYSRSFNHSEIRVKCELYDDECAHLTERSITIVFSPILVNEDQIRFVLRAKCAKLKRQLRAATSGTISLLHHANKSYIKSENTTMFYVDHKRIIICYKGSYAVQIADGMRVYKNDNLITEGAHYLLKGDIITYQGTETHNELFSIIYMRETESTYQ